MDTSPLYRNETEESFSPPGKSSSVHCPEHSLADDVVDRVSGSARRTPSFEQMLARVGPIPSASPRELTSRAPSREMSEAASTPASPANNVYIQAVLMFGVIAFGCLDVILRQIVAKTLTRFSYMLSFATAVAYCPIYWGVLIVLIKLEIVPADQMNWVWAGWRSMFSTLKDGLFSAPYLKLFLLAALGDAVGNGLGYICTPYVSGPVHSLLAQFTIMFTAILSMCLLRKCYSFAQILGLVGVEVAVLVGVFPSLQQSGGEENSSSPFFAVVLGGSCAFNAFAWVLKEKVFKLYKEHSNADLPARKQYSELHSSDSPMTISHVKSEQLKAEEGVASIPSSQDSLNVFVVNSHVSMFQLPLTLLLVPLAQATGQTHGQDVLSYLVEGFSCLAGNTGMGPLCSESAKFTFYYVICNILWNCTIIFNVKFNGALSTFVALKAISPCSALLFAYVDWPLLHTTSVKPLTWVVLILIMPFICFYVWASKQQQKRDEETPPASTCCWPLGSDFETACPCDGGWDLLPHRQPRATARGS